MKVHLLHRNKDLDWKPILSRAAEREAARAGRRRLNGDDFEPQSALPWNAEALTADLSLMALFEAMARDDAHIFEVARTTVLSAVRGDIETIRYRQSILRDCLQHSAVLRDLYALAVEAIEKQRGQYLGVLARYPDSVLRHGIDSMAIFLEFLKRLRGIADLHGGKFTSEGWIAFFAMLKQNLDDEYFTLVRGHLESLKLRNGELLSARLGQANKAGDYVLHRVPDRRWSLAALWGDIFAEKTDAYSFELHPRDEAGAQALGAIRNRGIALAANALGRSADHVRDFFNVLRAELAFYVGCVNLHEHLARKGEPVCIPVAVTAKEHGLSFEGLYDVGLALSIGGRAVGNDANADGRNLIIVTGPNTGGKSTFLRSLGLAQLMMQSGMFVAAEAFRAGLCDGLFTHYKREEDTSMKSGKFDEELGRMSNIVDHIGPSSMLLLNESFASTNEREGSEIARQIISALTEKGVRVFCVTHMYELARGFHERNPGDALFLRAERHVDGTRTFKLVEGAPLPTSFGEDLYERIFVSRKPPGPINECVPQL